jgi:hypothetical protein
VCKAVGSAAYICNFRQPAKPSRQSSDHSDDLTPNIHAGIVTAREKNRQAQRRFRERQKSLITELRDKVYQLEKQVCGEGVGRA